jgi:hypothetical protein
MRVTKVTYELKKCLNSQSSFSIFRLSNIEALVLSVEINEFYFPTILVTLINLLE